MGHRRFALLSLLVLPFLLGGVALAIVAVVTVRNELALREHRLVARGIVTARQISRSRSGSTTPSVRYTFTVPGSPTLYSHGDAMGRRDLWAATTPEAWGAAGVGGPIDVAYLPDDPWVNRPSAIGSSPLGDPIAGFAVGAAIALIFSALWLGMWRRLRGGAPRATS